jgi:hypothetical protein
MAKALNRSSKAKSPKEQSGMGETSHATMSGESRMETAQYIAEFAAELSFLARETRLDLLSYLLDMARLEAIRAVQANQDSR